MVTRKKITKHSCSSVGCFWCLVHFGVEETNLTGQTCAGAGKFFSWKQQKSIKSCFWLCCDCVAAWAQKVIHSAQVVGAMEQTNNSIYFLDYNKCIRLPRSQNAFLMYRHTHLPACGIIVAAIKFVMVCQKKASHVAYKTAMVKANWEGKKCSPSLPFSLPIRDSILKHSKMVP